MHVIHARCTTTSAAPPLRNRNNKAAFYIVLRTHEQGEGLIMEGSKTWCRTRKRERCIDSPAVDRNGAFKDLLLNISQGMGRENTNDLAFRTECNLPGTPSALEVLRELRKRGLFSPRSCANLETLLRKISRCDLADLVVEHTAKYPELTPGKRHASVQENASTPPTTPLKRSATDPPSVFRDKLQQVAAATGVRPSSPQVCQEETTGGRSELHFSSGSEAALPTASTPKAHLSSTYHAFHMECTPIAHVQPNRSYAQYNSSEQFGPEEPIHFSKLSTTHCDDNTSKGAKYVHSRVSRSATVSRENSFRSLSTNPQYSGSSLREKAFQLGHMAIDVAQLSLEKPFREQHMSSSSFSTSCSARYTDSDTHSAFSESDDVHMTLSKKDEQNVNGRLTAHERRRRRKPTPNSTQPHRDTSHSSGGPVPHYVHSSSENEALEDIDSVSDVPSYEGDLQYHEPVPDPVELRRKRTIEASMPHRSSVISDATPRQSLAIESRGISRNASESSFKRQSVLSDATTISNPRSSDVGREAACAQGPDNECLKPAPLLWKEKSSFWRKLALLRSRSSHSSPSSSWKVGREDLIKPIWRHQVHAHITRPTKLELNTNLGKHNPKLTFQLYPYGLHQDQGEAVTMAVRIATPDKCPPLPLSSEITLRLLVWGGEGRGREELRRCSPVTKELSTTSVFYVYTVITHDQLKRSECKHFRLEMQVSCSGL